MGVNLIGVQPYHCRGDFGGQPIHCHEEVEFVQVTQGRGAFRHGHTRHDTGPGTLLVVSPQDAHAGAPRTQDFGVRGLNVSTDWFEAGGLDWRPLRRREARCEGATLPAFARAYEAVCGSDSRLGQEEALLALYQSVSGCQYQEAAVETERVERAVLMLRERFAEEVSLTELAAAVSLTPTYLCRTFGRTVGLTPHAYQNSLRVARAKRLLEQGGAAGEVAAEVGFYDQSHLIRHFKRLLGVTPGDVRGSAISSYSPKPEKE